LLPEERPLWNLIDYINVMDGDLKVKDLWFNGTWDFSKVVTHILELIKQCIMAIPILLFHVIYEMKQLFS
jgi:hypothetical protein